MEDLENKQLKTTIEDTPELLSEIVSEIVSEEIELPKVSEAYTKLKKIRSEQTKLNISKGRKDGAITRTKQQIENKKKAELFDKYLQNELTLMKKLSNLDTN